MFQPNFKASFDLNNVYNQCKILEKKKTSEEKSNINKKDKKKA